MSHLVCPLCGKNAPLTNFHPDSLELDITLVNYKGIITEKGFEIPQRYSILGDDYLTPMVLNRVIELCNFFMSNNIITPDKMLERLGLKEDLVNPTEVNRLIDENYKLKIQLIETQKQLQNYRIPAEGTTRVNTNISKVAPISKSKMGNIEEKESRTAEIESELEDLVDMIQGQLAYVRERRMKRLKNRIEIKDIK